jgi:glycogen(starch) synthase
VRILHVTTEFPPIVYGGLGTAVGALVAASARAGLDVAILLIGRGGAGGYDMARADGAAGEEPSRVEPKGVWLFEASHADALRVGLDVVRTWQPDLIHLHAFWLWPVARAIRARSYVPIVYTVHSLDRAEYDLGHGPPECLWQWEIQADLIESCDRVVALTRSERDLIGNYCPVARGRVRVVGNGIADSKQARAAAERRGGDHAGLVLFTGRFVERKGIGELIDAIPMVLGSAPHVRFVLAGGHRGCSGEDMARLWLPTTADGVEFTGWLEASELAGWYSVADVLVVPSWYEPFGMVVLEGMLYGLAIAAANVGGPAEILEDGVTGLLFAAHDPRALASAVIQLLLDSALRRKLQTAAAIEVRRRWLYSRVVQEMKRVYEEVLRESRPVVAALPA